MSRGIHRLIDNVARNATASPSLKNFRRRRAVPSGRALRRKVLAYGVSLAGKQKLLALGVYPDVTLQGRAHRGDASTRDTAQRC